MSRLRVIIGGTILAVLAAAVPIAVMVYATWDRAVSVEQQRLHAIAERSLRRTEVSYQEALAALKSAEATVLPPCGAEHIQRMQTLVMTTPSSDQMGYFEGGKLRCTSWGPFLRDVDQPTPDHVTSDGVGITVDVRPEAAGRRPMLSIMYGSYDVLVDPRRFVDVIVDPDVRLALASPDGRLLTQQDGMDPTLLQQLLREPGEGLDRDTLYASARSGEWLAIATAPRTALAATFRQQAWLFVPLGLLMAAAGAGLVIWLSRRRLSMRGELRIAIRRRELYLHYQPIIELDTGICVGAEALVRWQRPDGTQVRPDLFIPLAEEAGMIAAITDLVIENVVADMRELLAEDRSAHIAINLAAEDISSGRALKVISQRMAGSGILPQQIWLEATEHGFLDIDRARTMLAAARRAGHSVAIDDFGVGYSSLQYLQQLPLDALKIDKSFIDAIGTESATSPVTPHIIGMAGELGLWVVAEGVETEAQLAYLHSQHVQFGQGWLFSRPLPRDEFIAFHRKRQQQYGAAREHMQNPRSVPFEREQAGEE
ncbi:MULTISPECIES: EAL domain-containing protein [Stenotrophomonas]|uniref:EAL domain-containing protein n=1 Tax=Stenotrophomonas TaxID=40323 RepID=UPI000B6FBB68|nr:MULTISPECIES: EAL domain-containing protein [Stenotrophomonas]SMR82812.1 sensor c-di-GMP phosphodiesterase, contains CSS-motif sensor and EAL domain [Stenotrophomonas sp. yr243]SNT47166.1 sensor c-di-GMP phosphodiesterase, contains CSS-motif sensor and EAL domain [Stenotrophomonas lactitubi]